MGSQEGLSCQVGLPSHQQILPLHTPDTHRRTGPVLGMPAPRAPGWPLLCLPPAAQGTQQGTPRIASVWEAACVMKSYDYMCLHTLVTYEHVCLQI